MTPQEWATKIAAELQGTCTFLSTKLGEYDQEGLEDDMQFCLKLDELVFCCTRCDWWHEQSEMAARKDDAWICEDCTDDDERE